MFAKAHRLGHGIIAGVGLALLWWFSAAVMATLPFNGALAEYAFNRALYMASAAVGVALTFVGGPLKPTGLLVRAGAVVLCVVSYGGLLGWGAWGASPSLGLLVASLLSSGVGYGWLMIGWGSYLILLPKRDIALAVMVGAAVLAMCPLLIGLPGAVWFAFALPVGCAILLQCAPVPANLSPRTPYPLVFKASLACGAMLTAVSFGAADAVLPGARSLGAPTGACVGVVVVGVLAAIMYAKRDGLALGWRVVSTLLLAGCAAALVSFAPQDTTVFSQVSAEISAILVYGGYRLFELALWFVTIDLAKNWHRAPIRLIQSTFVLTIGGQAVGNLLVLALLQWFPTGEATFAVMAIVAVCLLVALVWLISSHAIERAVEVRRPTEAADGMAADGSSWPPRPVVEGLEGAGLTSREIQIALMLARGRSAKHISSELVISENTVWTHIRHIYRKMEVANRQEFLSKLDGF